jgi:hypothetical protein
MSRNYIAPSHEFARSQTCAETSMRRILALRLLPGGMEFRPTLLDSWPITTRALRRLPSHCGTNPWLCPRRRTSAAGHPCSRLSATMTMAPSDWLHHLTSQTCPVHTARGVCHLGRFVTRSPRQRIGAQLELDDLGPRAFATFEVKRRSGGVGRPQPLALPAAIRIVDAPVHPFGEEAHGIGNA